MSGFIQAQVMRKRQMEADAKDRARFLASAKGDPGPQGPKGDTGPVPAHEWNGTKLRFQKPDGEWGKFVDLKGDTGPDHGTVVIHSGGPSGTDLAALPIGTEGADPSGLVVMQAGKFVNLPWAIFVTAIAGAVDMGSAQARRVDFFGDSIIYRGEAPPGADEAAPVWRVKRIQFSTDETGRQDISEQWAGGDGSFTYAWTDHETLEYI